LSALKSAPLEEIKRVKGISEKNAESVFNYFTAEGEEGK